MSRTDAHTPYWVKERDCYWRAHFKEDHNHSWYVTGNERVQLPDGRWRYKSVWSKVERCDLDVYLSARGFVRTACRLRTVSSGKNIFCGCSKCTGQISRRLDRRSDRQRAKRLIRSGRWDDASYVNRSHLSW